MERTRFFNYTKPSQLQLNNTEDSKARGILRRARSNFQFGTRTGFRITINPANNTQIDIGAGDGFTGGFYKSENLKGSPNSGERVSTLTDAATGQAGYTKTAEGVGLIDYSANTKNYVCLKYTESESTPLAERYYPFNTHNTIVAETYLVEVYTEAQWNALTTAELEQRVLVGVVTAQGAGNPLSLANIEQMVQPKSHPVAGTQPSNITGVIITGVSDEALIGNGTLRFEAATKKLYWTAPGDAEGTGVVMGSSGTYTIYSDDLSYWIFIEVIFAGLPAADDTDTIRIESLYGRNIPMACAIDQAHRDMLGTGVLSPTNPHGTSIDDITGGTFEHADLYHVNGISGDAEEDQLECSISHADNSIEIENNGGMRNSFLIDGISYDLLAGYTAGMPGKLTFSPIVPVLDSGDYLIYIDSKGQPQYVKIAEYAPGGPADTTVLWSANIQIVDMHNEASGNGNIAWDNATWGLVYTAPGDAAGTPVHVTPFGAIPHYGYYKLYSNNEIDWVIVFVSNNLGFAANTTFAITKNETEHPDDSILKIGVVTWNQLGEIHANMRDIRNFNTADNRDEVEEEHDDDGKHTKTLQSQLSVAVANSLAIYGRASEDIGVLGYALTNTGVYGSAENDIGVGGIAGRDYGGQFRAIRSIGVYGTAATRGVVGEAAGPYGGSFSAGNICGVYGTADIDYGGNFNAGGNIGVRGSAAGNIGVRGVAVNTGVQGEAGEILVIGGNTGVFGKAYRVAAVGGDYGGRFEAQYDYGVFGSAVNNTGVYGKADVNYGLYGSACVNYGVYGEADANYGGYFKADGNNATALVGWAAGAGGAEIGVHGSVAAVIAGTGVYGQAGGYGVYGTAALGNATGIAGFAGAAGATGVYGSGGLYGVYGTAENTAVCGVANVDYGGYFWANAGNGIAIGIWGIANYVIAIGNDGVNKADAPKQDVPFSCGMVPILIGGNSYRLAIFDPS